MPTATQTNWVDFAFKGGTMFLALGQYLISQQTAGIKDIAAETKLVASAVGEMRTKVAVMEANQFTKNEEKLMRDELLEVKTKCFSDIASMNARLNKIPDELPPKWVTDKLSKLESDVSQLNTSVTVLSARRR